MLRLILLLGLAVATPGPTAGRSPAADTAPAPRSDAQIEQDIRTRLARSKVGRNGFTVRVRNGVAFWEGRTEIPQHKGTATRMAKSAGARSVVNNIQVAPKDPRRVQVKPRP